MPRLSIELSPQEHKQLKTLATLNGQSMKAYVLTRTFETQELPYTAEEEKALTKLTAFLKERAKPEYLAAAKPVTLEEIRQKALARKNR